MAQRIEVPQRANADWEKLIVQCLTNSGNFKWGCLNKKNKLFRISTLTSVQVPKQVVESMQRSGLLKLNNEDYYVYVPRRKKRVLY